MTSFAQGDCHFRTTHWSVVRRAAGSDPQAAEAALATLCQTYWYPLYAYFRRAGRSAHDAEDLTQGLFTRLLSREIFAEVAPERGRLRSFLLTCARNYLADDRDRAQARKRGAGLLVSIDPDGAEERYQREPADLLSLDRLFQRRWALAVLETSLAGIEQEFTARGKGALFTALRPFLGFSAVQEEDQETVSARLQIPIGTLKSHIFRLRQRWHEILFEQVAATLDDPTPDNIRSELSELLGCV
jgi:RNA polymerase sigma-70 factor (ECF subfamily)